MIPIWNKEFKILAQERNLIIETDLESSTIEMNQMAFQKVWNNLMINAIRYSNEVRCYQSFC